MPLTWALGVKGTMNYIADKEWYQGVSESKGVSLHCPFATADRCPRYYQSISLFSKTGGTSLSPEEDSRLFEKWEKTEFWPKIAEHETSVGHSGEKLISISNFCPEVTFDRYGCFCSSLGAYADEMDSGYAQERLSNEGVSISDPRWRWAHSYRVHFTECPLYSLLSHPVAESKEVPKEVVPIAPPWWREHLATIVVGIVLALAAAIIKLVFS